MCVTLRVTLPVKRCGISGLTHGVSGEPGPPSSSPSGPFRITRARPALFTLRRVVGIVGRAAGTDTAGTPVFGAGGAGRAAGTVGGWAWKARDSGQGQVGGGWQDAKVQRRAGVPHAGLERLRDGGRSGALAGREGPGGGAGSGWGRTAWPTAAMKARLRAGWTGRAGGPNVG